MSGRGEPTTGAGRALLADDWGAIGPEGMLTRILAIEAAAAREALPSVEEMARALHDEMRGAHIAGIGTNDDIASPRAAICHDPANHREYAERILAAIRARRGGEG